MSETMLDLEDEKLQVTISAAKKIRFRHHQWVELDDLIQEGIVWAAEHPASVASFFRDIGDDPKMVTLALRRYGKRMERVLEARARDEKAARSGYSPHDEFFYARSLLESVLPVLWHPDLMSTPPETERAEISAQGDPAEAGNWLAFCLDIKRAVEKAKLSLTEEAGLRLRYAQGLSEEKAAQVLCLSRFAFRDMMTRVMRRIDLALNGVTPDRGDPDGEED